MIELARQQPVEDVEARGVRGADARVLPPCGREDAERLERLDADQLTDLRIAEDAHPTSRHFRSARGGRRAGASSASSAARRESDRHAFYQYVFFGQWERLRDHARDILLATVDDMRSPQNVAQRAEKSKGHGPQDDALNGASESHAIGRLGSGFDLPEVVSEYRALRASVLQLWSNSKPTPEDRDLDDLTRFNESIDQSLTEAVLAYTQHVERDRAARRRASGSGRVALVVGQEAHPPRYLLRGADLGALPFFNHPYKF